MYVYIYIVCVFVCVRIFIFNIEYGTWWCCGVCCYYIVWWCNWWCGIFGTRLVVVPYVKNGARTSYLVRVESIVKIDLFRSLVSMTWVICQVHIYIYERTGIKKTKFTAKLCLSNIGENLKRRTFTPSKSQKEDFFKSSISRQCHLHK